MGTENEHYNIDEAGDFSVYTFPTLDSICQTIAEAGLQDKVILCLGSAAGMLRISNLCSTTVVYVFTELSQEELPERVKKVEMDYKNKAITVVEGFTCTTAEQSILDMLTLETDVGNEDLYESLYTYYVEHVQSFQGLIDQMDSHQKAVFELYRDDAIHLNDF